MATAKHTEGGEGATGAYLVRVESDFAVFGFVVKNRVVTRECAPIAKWAIGRRGREVVDYWRKRGAKVTWIALP